MWSLRIRTLARPWFESLTRPRTMFTRPAICEMPGSETLTNGAQTRASFMLSVQGVENSLLALLPPQWLLVRCQVQHPEKACCCPLIQARHSAWSIPTSFTGQQPRPHSPSRHTAFQPAQVQP